MELKGKGAGSQGYPPRGLGQRPNSTHANEPARPPRNPNSPQNRRSLQIPAHSQEMIARDLRVWLNLCSNESLVTFETIQKPGGFDYVYKIAPGMKSALDEMLYDRLE
jgi:hypothetical protein